MFTLTVRNYRRIRRADIALAPISLCAGLNEAGKTSLVQAAQACLAKNAMPGAKLVLKKDAAALVHDGEKEASARITAGDDGRATEITWPKCVPTQKGEGGGPYASDHAVGLLNVLDLPAKERLPHIAGLVDVAVTVTDLAKAMADAGYGDEAVDKVWASIQAEGWDGYAKKAVEATTKLKGQWEGATGEAYGPKKAAEWLPKWFRAGLTEEDVKDELAEAQAELDAALRGAGRSEADIERLKAESHLADGIDLANLESARKAAEYTSEKATAALAALPADRQAGPVTGCPHCGADVEIMVERVDAAQTRFTLRAPEAEMPKAADDLRKARAAAVATEVKAKAAASDAREAEAKGRASVERAKAAAIELAKVATSDDSKAKVERAKERMSRADIEAKAFSAKITADRLHATIDKNAKLVEILKPDGLRRQKLASGLDALNAKLADLAKVAGWKPLTFNADLDASYGPHPLALVSESAGFRARVLIQVAIAMADGSEALVIDRADLLDAKGRNGLFRLLKHAGRPALVAMTFSAAKLVPDLAKAGMGAAYWLEGGEARPLDDVLAEAA
jgi:hypothetical protein